MTPADLLRDVGLALYGEQFKSELGRALGVHERQVRRWLSGEYTPPPGVWSDLTAICRERRDTLAKLSKPLSEAAKLGL